MKFILIGAGQRGMIYAKCAHDKGHEIVAVAEVDTEKRETACRELGIPEDSSFASAEVLLAKDRLADAAIIATMDLDHYRHAIPAMEKGYHLLLEKPISPIPEETLEMAAVAQKLNRHVVVCHVLRYAPFFREIKKLLDSGIIGRVITIQHNENIGNYHFAHSFVRGNWRRKDQASSVMMQKSCHDMDLLAWLVGSGCKQIASFGDLTYFKAYNAPKEAAQRCKDCALKNDCRFSAYRSYMPVMGGWPTTVLTNDQTSIGLEEAIESGAYGRCVYHCDNDVCDHQVTILEFDNGVTVTFNLSGFTNRMGRTLKIMGENGELRASELENTIEVIPFCANAVDQCETIVIHPEIVIGGHGGGDKQIVEDFVNQIEGKPTEMLFDIAQSVESHMMACAAEEARLMGSVVNVSEYQKNHARG